MKDIQNETHMKFTEFPQFGILSGIKVVVTGLNIAGPFAGCMMAEMGAQVIQIENPKMPCQTRANYGFTQNHRNTFSMNLDIGSGRGAEVFEKLLTWADAWIESGRPGTYAKLGFPDERAWELNPKLAIVHVSGYGQYGPDKDKAAYDVSGQAMSGYMYMNGAGPTAPPLRVNPYISDYVTAFNACNCCLSILLHAKMTGQGDAADVSQYETMFRILDTYPMEWFNVGYPGPGEPVPYRSGNASQQAAGFSFYDCKDGILFVGMTGVGVVRRGYPLVGLPTPGSGEDPDFYENMHGSKIDSPVGQRIDAAIAAFCAQYTVAEAEKIFNDNGIPNQRVFTPADIEESPHFAAREDIITWEDSIFGTVRGIGIMNKFTRNPAQVVSSAPTFGEHTREIVSNLGFSDAFIDEMFNAGEARIMTAEETARFWRFKETGFFWSDEQAKRLGIE